MSFFIPQNDKFWYIDGRLESYSGLIVRFLKKLTQSSLFQTLTEWFDFCKNPKTPQAWRAQHTLKVNVQTDHHKQNEKTDDEN